MTATQETNPLQARIEFLKKIHLFYQVDETRFEAIASRLVERKCRPGEFIIRQGHEGERFYMIFSGSVEVVRETTRGRDSLGKLVAGDYFGEESLLTNKRTSATVKTSQETVLLCLSKADFGAILKQIPQLKANFSVAVTSRRLARSLKFSWLRDEEGEVIYFLARKHQVLLYQKLLLPVVAAFFVMLGILLSLNLPGHILLWVFVGALGLIIGWGFWNFVDWGNDYYIVTNQRVIWLEKVVGIYDSRQEAPLSAVQRINVQTDYWGRQLNYGTLIVRTIVGTTLTLQNVDHPMQAAALIEEQWKRSKQTARKEEEGAMREALRKRFMQKGSEPEKLPSLLPKPAAKPVKSPVRPGLFDNLFKVRIEGLSTITYRKHWIVLVEKTWIPSLLLLTLVVFLFFGIFDRSLGSVPTLLKNSGVDALLVVWFLLTLGVFLWWYYQYVDWSNDVFQVTPDQILDINKKPLGQVVRDIAALDNILHLEYERKGLMQILFNYGNVYITIGGGKDMTFESVFDPSAVQDDIERRRLERIMKKEQDNIKAERERMADWFAAYHHSTGEFPKFDNPEENKPVETQT